MAMVQVHSQLIGSLMQKVASVFTDYIFHCLLGYKIFGVVEAYTVMILQIL